MIKILELGEKAKPMKTICPNCDSKLEFSLSDCECTFNPVTNEIYIYHLTCPACDYFYEVFRQ